LETARRQGENIAREAHIKATEESLKLRDQAEQALAARLSVAAEAEKRLGEREVLINRQLENMVQEEKILRSQQAECHQKAEELDLLRTELVAMSKQRRKALEAAARLPETEARQLLLKEVEMESLQDASNLTRRIVEEAKTRAEEKARRIISMAIQRYA